MSDAPNTACPDCDNTSFLVSTDFTIGVRVDWLSSAVKAERPRSHGWTHRPLDVECDECGHTWTVDGDDPNFTYFSALFGEELMQGGW